MAPTPLTIWPDPRVQSHERLDAPVQFMDNTGTRAELMKDFSNASFPPETIVIMEDALQAAIATLPDPVHSTHLQAIAETILRTAKDGERDPVTLKRMALLELQITSRE
jgi:hypothetical protein